MKMIMRQRASKWLLVLSTILSPLLWGVMGSGLFLTSCSETDDTVDEYADWQKRNEAFVASLASDSLRSSGSQWLRLKSYSLDATAEGAPGDYVYVKVISQGEGTDSPMLTDSVRVSYRGRLIPSATYPEGFIFDGTYYSSYNNATNATAKFVMVSSGYETVVSGWVTALLHMHRGDHWRVYIPHQLGYGSQDQSSTGIPAYSTLVFDITLVDFSPAGQAMQPFSSRRSSDEE